MFRLPFKAVKSLLFASVGAELNPKLGGTANHTSYYTCFSCTKCLSARDLIAFYASKRHRSRISPEYFLRSQASHSRAQTDAHLILPLLFTAGGRRGKAPAGFFHSADSLAFDRCCVIPTSRPRLEARVCHEDVPCSPGRKPAHLLSLLPCLSGSRRSNSRSSRLCSKERCQD